MYRQHCKRLYFNIGEIACSISYTSQVLDELDLLCKYEIYLQRRL